MNYNLSSLAFEITTKCNLACSFCLRNVGNKSTSSSNSDLRIEQFKNYFDTAIKDQEQSIDLIAITGGEPFLNKDLVPIVEYAARNPNHTVTITTNGTIVDEKVITELSRLNNIQIIVSLDGSIPSIHDHIRGHEGAFDKTVKFIKIISKYKINFAINSTMSNDNYTDTYNIIKLASNLGTNNISIALAKPHGRGKQEEINSKILTEVGYQILAARKNFSQKVQILFSEPLAHIFDVGLEKYSIGTCGAGANTAHIQFDGTMLFCTSSDESFGNILSIDQSIPKTLQDNQIYHAIHQKIFSDKSCNNCYAKSYCGGCRCRSKNLGQNFLHSDPLCPKNICKINPNEVEKFITGFHEKMYLANAKTPSALTTWLSSWNNSIDRNDHFDTQKCWGHNWLIDKQSLVEGEMGWRHIEIFQNWIRHQIIPQNLSGKKILDIGPWTGGESYLLAYAGGEIDIFEENNHYKDTILEISKQYNLAINIRGSSLYEIISDEYHSKYDYAYLSGIITHLTDPICGLRAVFNTLKDGGICLLETQTSYDSNGSDNYWGADTPGWVWFNPSRYTLMKMLKDVGFEELEIVDFTSQRRIQIAARKIKWKPMNLRMGLSYPNIP